MERKGASSISNNDTYLSKPTSTARHDFKGNGVLCGYTAVDCSGDSCIFQRKWFNFKATSRIGSNLQYYEYF